MNSDKSSFKLQTCARGTWRRLELACRSYVLARRRTAHGPRLREGRSAWASGSCTGSLFSAVVVNRCFFPFCCSSSPARFNVLSILGMAGGATPGAAAHLNLDIRSTNLGYNAESEVEQHTKHSKNSSENDGER